MGKKKKKEQYGVTGIATGRQEHHFVSCGDLGHGDLYNCPGPSLWHCVEGINAALERTLEALLIKQLL